MNKLPKRKSPRKAGFDYTLGGAYFITICTFNKNKILSEIIPLKTHTMPKVKLSEIGKQIENCLLSFTKVYNGFEVGDYIIMPNHIHFILHKYNYTDTSVSEIIRRFKTYTTNLYGQKLWQRSFYDHIIVNEKDYDNVSEYIYENPARWVYDDMN